nr:MAG TPA: hypothetical protein [Caudoviricetes sp.]
MQVCKPAAYRELVSKPGANPGVRTLPYIHVADLISTKLEGSSYQVSLSTLIGKGTLT